MSIRIHDIFTEYKDAKIRTGVRSRQGFTEIENFIAFIRTNGEEFLSHPYFAKWLKLRKKKLSKYSLQQCYQILQSFSVWANIVDERHQKFPKRKRRLNGRRTPIIINENQAYEIVESLKTSCTQRVFSGVTYSVVAGLLLATGMRVSEAYLHLRDEDVNLEYDSINYIYVRASKAARDRYIPIDHTTADILREYRENRISRFPYANDKFFMIHHGTPKCTSSFRNVFNKVTAELGYRSKSQEGYKSKSLLVHDLRHSFATNMLLHFHKNGLDVKSEITKLSIVLGHQSIDETYYYIESIPELLTLVLQKGECDAA